MGRLNIIGISGSPGTGKKTIGPLVAKVLGWKIVHLNKLALSGGAVIRRDRYGFVVDPVRLQNLTVKAIRNGNVVVVGHLLPAVLRRGEVDFVAILRCEPVELERRLNRRGYGEEKVRQNVASEILDVCFVEVLQRFGSRKIGEFDTTRRIPTEVAAEVVETFQNRMPRRIGHLNWMLKVYAERKLDHYFPARV